MSIIGDIKRKLFPRLINNYWDIVAALLVLVVAILLVTWYNRANAEAFVDIGASYGSPNPYSYKGLPWADLFIGYDWQRLTVAYKHNSSILEQNDKSDLDSVNTYWRFRKHNLEFMTGAGYVWDDSYYGYWYSDTYLRYWLDRFRFQANFMAGKQSQFGIGWGFRFE